jgi:hypothetical protein
MTESDLIIILPAAPTPIFFFISPQDTSYKPILFGPTQLPNHAYLTTLVVEAAPNNWIALRLRQL